MQTLSATHQSGSLLPLMEDQWLACSRAHNSSFLSCYLSILPYQYHLVIFYAGGRSESLHDQTSQSCWIFESNPSEQFDKEEEKNIAERLSIGRKRMCDQPVRAAMRPLRRLDYQMETGTPVR